MEKFKVGDIVVRKSYGKDIIFEINNIKNEKNKKIFILKGVIERIEADSEIEDLELLEKAKVDKMLRKIEENFENKIDEEKRNRKLVINGRVLHLDRR